MIYHVYCPPTQNRHNSDTGCLHSILFDRVHHSGETKKVHVPAVLELGASVNIPLYCCDKQESSEVASLPVELSSISSEPFEEKHAGYNSALFYIYTSGTTGRKTFL